MSVKGNHTFSLFFRQVNVGKGSAIVVDHDAVKEGSLKVRTSVAWPSCVDVSLYAQANTCR